MIIAFSIILVSLIFSAFFSGIETGHYTIDQVNLHYRMQKGDKSAKRLNRVMKDSQIFIFTVLICNNLAVYVGSSSMTSYYASVMGDEVTMILGTIPWSAETAATLTLLLPFFLFGEALPKNIFRNKSYILYSLSRPMQLLVWLFIPFTLPLKMVAKFLVGSTGDFGSELQNLTMQKLRFFIKKGRKGGIISGTQDKMINNILNAPRVKITELMIPIRSIKSISMDSTPSQALQFIKKYKVNSVPLHDKRKNNIIGVVRFFEIMEALEKSEKLIEKMSGIENVQADSTIKKVFFIMQSKKVDIVKIIDHNGKVKGLLKFKDIVKLITK